MLYSCFPLAICFIHGSICRSIPFLIPLPQPSSSPPPCVHTSILYSYVSIPSLKIGSSVPYVQMTCPLTCPTLLCSKHFLTSWSCEMVQAHLVFSLRQPLNQSFLQRALVSFIGKWHLETVLYTFLKFHCISRPS